MANETGALRQTLVGVFVVGGIVLATFAFVAFGNFTLFSNRTRAVVIFQHTVAGLSIGAPVTFRGVKIGTVDSVVLRYDPVAHTAYMPVTVTLDPRQIGVVQSSSLSVHGFDLQAMISQGLRAEQNIQSFVTGTVNINLNFYPGSPAVLHSALSSLTEIPTHESTMQKLRETLTDLPLRELVDNANDAVVSMKDVAHRLDGDLPPLVASLYQSSQGAQETLRTATKAISVLQDKLTVTLADIDTLMRTGNRQLEARGEDLHQTLASATRATDEARRTLEGVESIVSTRSADRENFDAALRDVAAAAASLRGFAGDVERNPQLLLLGRRQ
ncbi:MCE family protein [Gluconacetobacter azotocaptans]|uniref:MlaD family protein n=1 Tax=Gluconacetobacter azotocaptans TaxID=142834 RepID=UPI001957F2B0|nr:MlaD family protein [Gluconacetobacter azotocaptans]MBM9401151.1 MCE family protein [Gluconacetobacter azotocaptans]